MANWEANDQGSGRFVRAPSPDLSSIGEDRDNEVQNQEMAPEMHEGLGGSPLSEIMDPLYTERADVAQDLERLCMEILDEEVSSHLNSPDLLVRQEQLEENYREFKNLHREFRRNNPQSSSQIFINTEAMFMNARARIMTLLKGLEPEGPASSTRMDRTEHGHTTFRVELPVAPNVGTFDGQQSKWPEFRDKFIAQVHDRDHINPVDKMSYLQAACTGGAQVVLGPWPPTKEGYDGAWKALLEAYDDDYHTHKLFFHKYSDN